MLQVFSIHLYHSSYIEDEVRRIVLSWISSKVTILHEGQRRKFFRQNLLWRASIRKCLDQISLSYAWSYVAKSSGWYWKLVACLSSIKVFHPESRDAILLRGEGCNTPGVCHQLSNGFELEHGILSDDEDVKVQPIETSPNLNLDIAPLLYI